MLAAINYHYIRTSFDYKYPSIFGIKPKKFENQLKALQKVGQFISQTQLREHIEKNECLPENALLITFDDGLKEQYQLAYPILERLNIPFVFFVNTHAATEQKLLNVHKIHIVRSQIAPNDMMGELKVFIKENNYDVDFDRAEYEGIAHYKYDIPSAAKLKFALNFLLNQSQQDIFIDHLFSELFDDRETDIAANLYMGFDEIRDLGQKGYIGSHSHHHNPIGLLEQSKQEFEVKHSKKILEDITQTEIFGLSYPYGSLASCSGVGKILKKYEYKYAFTMERALNSSVNNCFYLSRFDNNDMPLGKSYPFQKHTFFDQYPTSSWDFK